MSLVLAVCLLLCGVGFSAEPESRADANAESPPIATLSEQHLKFVGGSTLRLEANIEGTEPLAYQWYERDIAIPGEIRANLTISNCYSAGPFFAIAQNGLGKGTGTVTHLELIFPPLIQRTATAGPEQLTDLQLAAGSDLYLRATTDT